ncbi:MAG: hypothetical protein V3V03_01490 [Hyphomonadaceae bacterium]
MRKWLILLLVLVLALAGVALWLGSKATSGKPAPGEVRQEIENVL